MYVKDNVLWIFWPDSTKVISHKGNFSVKCAYSAITASCNNAGDSIWSFAWKWNGPQSIRMFLWMAPRDRLKTKSELMRRHFQADINCERCGLSETTLHTLHDCFFAKRLWDLLLRVNRSHNFFELNLRIWMQQNLKSNWRCSRGPTLALCVWCCHMEIMVLAKSAHFSAPSHWLC